MYLFIPAVIYQVVISMLSQCSASELDREMNSRGPDVEDKSCIRVRSRGAVTRDCLRLGNKEGKPGCSKRGETRRVTLE